MKVAFQKISSKSDFRIFSKMSCWFCGKITKSIVTMKFFLPIIVSNTKEHQIKIRPLNLNSIAGFRQGFKVPPLKLGPPNIEVPPNNSAVRVPKHLSLSTLRSTHNGGGGCLYNPLLDKKD